MYRHTQLVRNILVNDRIHQHREKFPTVVVIKLLDMLALLTITTLAVGCVTTVVGSDGDVDGVVNVQGYAIPQLGIGVGNLPKDSVSTLVRSAVDDHHIVLIDTARQSKNENFVREAIESLSPDAPVPIVLTKVWYTYLGYNRTILSVEKSLAELGKTCLDIVLLHWPRCNDKISWMNCKEEEENLPAFVRNAGPAPHLGIIWYDHNCALVQQKGLASTHERLHNIGPMPLALIVR